MMNLGVATHFSQGWPQTLLDTTIDLGLTRVRDSMTWSIVETTRGVYDFSDWRLSYVDPAQDKGLEVSLVFHPYNPLYEGGTTPYTEEAITAFADFVVASLDEHEDVTTIEIGNEFNSDFFVSGKVLADGYEMRAEYYARILDGVSEAVRATHPDVTIIGGALHSVPVGYAAVMGEAGAFEDMDAVAIHPYSSRPEELPQQIELLNEVTGDLPIHVTEFGDLFESLDEGPTYLVKMSSIMADAGVVEAQWYALYEQPMFPNMELVSRSGASTPAGESMDFITDMLFTEDTIERLPSESSAYAYLYGEDKLVLWGDGQKVSFGTAVDVYDARGARIADFDGILRDDPVIVDAAAALTLGDNLFLEDVGLLGHSVHDFDVIAEKGDASGFEGPWSYFARYNDGRLDALYTMPGGTKSSEPWTPYLSHDYLKPLRLTTYEANPYAFSSDPGGRVAILERLDVEEDATATITAHWDVRDASEDGIDVAITLNGRTIFSDVVFNPANGHVRDVVLEDVELSAGDTIDFITGPNLNSRGGDMTERMFKVVAQGDGKADTGDDDDGGDAAIVWGPADRQLLDGTADDDVLDASPATMGVRIKGRQGDDHLTGGDRNDTLAGGQGSDTLIGGEGNDRLIIDANDVFDGGAGLDIVRTKSTGGSVDLAEANAERAIGVGGDDRFDGSDSASALKLRGGGGDDTLIGGAGNDTLVGGPGEDTFQIAKGGGDDRIADFEDGDILAIDWMLAPSLEVLQDAAVWNPNGLRLQLGEDSIFLVGQDPSMLTDDAVMFF